MDQDDQDMGEVLGQGEVLQACLQGDSRPVSRHCLGQAALPGTDQAGAEGEVRGRRVDHH